MTKKYLQEFKGNEQRIERGEQMQGLQKEAENRQRGEQWSKRSEDFEQSGGDRC